MTILHKERILLDREMIELLAAKEIDRQLECLPDEVVKLLNKASAIAYLLNFISPLQSVDEKGNFGQHNRTIAMLEDLISEAAALSVLRLLCIPLMTEERQDISNVSEKRRGLIEYNFTLNLS
ncbi:hypothetical protein PN499_17345 [Kamptonema animale CS-326]|jgi:hypothetical protein|uniref:hypothetical protein n=1 Tax=Kamptonema animale TaxID=92934 RepID=UPI002330E6F0|nr:hypothetical protein [Kamptonema animale]MDB9512959.1 hypothetical protein [Kamptonema animale CS-326]